MKQNKKILVALLGFTLTFSACKRDQVENTRSSITIMGLAQSGQKLESIPALISPLENFVEGDDSNEQEEKAINEKVGTVSACDRLEALSREERSTVNFSYLDLVRIKNGEVTGSMNLAQSPFVQYVLGEQFKAGSEDDFYEAAKKEHDVGNVGFMKWMVVNIMKGIGLLDMIQYPTINSKLSEKFPGIYGGEEDLSNSLQLQLLNKANTAAMLEKDPRNLERYASIKLPLFPANRAWQQWSTSVRLNWSAALSAMRKNSDSLESQKQRVCGTVLAHLSFSQLMAFKGYMRPVWTINSAGRATLQELSSDYPEFSKVPVTGGIYDPAQNSSIIMDNVSIQKYDPAQKLLQVTAETPNGNLQHQAGNLNDSLAIMEALLYNFEASSPAANWVANEGDYIFGDIQKTDNKAILPAEAHALSLGLLTMQFKNLAANHIRKVNAKGILAAKDDMVTGIALSSEAYSSDPVVRVKLNDVIRLTRVVSYFDYALNSFTKAGPEKWGRMNGVYASEAEPENKSESIVVNLLKAVMKKAEPRYKTLALLHGGAMFSQTELERMLTTEERQNILRDNLKNLKLPLAILLVQLGTSNSECFTEMTWNLQTGEKVRSGNACSAKERANLKAALMILAQDTQAPILLKKARGL